MFVLISACGGGTATTPDPSDPADPEPTEPTEPTDPAGDTAYEDMSHEQQAEHMSDVVVPAMAALFAEYDGESFGELNCATCHGENAAANGFEMPSAEITVLPPFGTPEQRQIAADQPEMVAFMVQRVVPEMARLLGKQPFDPETGTGFGCGACHTHTDDAVGDH